MDVNGLISQFGVHMRTLGLRIRTRFDYCRYAACFALSDLPVDEFLFSRSPSVRGPALAALRRFATFLGDAGVESGLQQRVAAVHTPALARLIQNDMLRARIETTKERPTVQAAAFHPLWRAAADEVGTDRADQLLRPALVLGLLCGLRRGDLLAATWEWVDWDTKQLLVPDPKGGRPYVVPLSDQAADHLATLFERRQDERSDPIVQRPKTKHAATNRTTLTRELARLKITPHALRRGFATGMLDKGVPTPTVAKLMNHKSPETTYRNYYTPDKEVLRDAVSKLTPED